MNPRGIVATTGLVVFALVAVLLLLIPATDNGADCGGDLSNVWASDAAVPAANLPTVRGWTPTQVRNAAAVIAAGVELRVPTKGQAIAVMTAIGESSLIVVDHGDAAGPDSRGLFQQRDNGAWGTYADRMDPRISSMNFYKALLKVPGWEGLPPTIAAHRVQRNADPYHYQKFWTPALDLMSALTGSETVTAMLAAGASNNCDQNAMIAGGAVVWPVPASLKGTDRHNWGHTGGIWASKHTGTDFSVSCGTPVYAAHAGTVVLDHSQSWAGPTLVKVSTGKDSLTTWYAHMQVISVRDGQQVGPGTRLGDVGARGNVTGCHLHFEVHPRNGSIYADNINPSTWLEANVGHTVPGTGGTTVPVGTGPGPIQGQAGPGWFAVATFNVLGHSHTGPGGDKGSWPDSPSRTVRLANWFASYKPDVVGLQEFQRPQFEQYRRLVGGSYDTWPRQQLSGSSGHNVITWRRTSFDLVQAGYLKVPYFNGNETSMPVAMLRQRSTGKIGIFINIHNPADTGKFQNQGHWRAVGLARERALVLSLSQRSQKPVYLMGDFNARRDPFCVLAAGGLMSTPAGGAMSGGCRIPPRPQIDWIFGTNHKWAYFRIDTRPRQTRMSDHPYVTAATTL